MTPPLTLHTGTTVCLVRYDKGYLLASDRRASYSNGDGIPLMVKDMCKVDVAYYDAQQCPRICYVGAGEATPLVRAASTVWGLYLRQYQRKKGVTLSSLRTEKQVCDYLCEYLYYLQDTRKVWFRTGMGPSSILLSPMLVRTDHLTVGLMNVCHHDIIPLSQMRDLKGLCKATPSFLATGSGEPHLGAVLYGEDVTRPLSQRPLQQIRDVLVRGYQSAIGRDLYSHSGGTPSHPIIDMYYIEDGKGQFVCQPLPLPP